MKIFSRRAALVARKPSADVNARSLGEKGWLQKDRSVYRLFMLTVLLMISALILSSCDGGGGESNKGGLSPYGPANVKAASRITFPSYVTSEILDSYEFAVARPEVLQYMPCYCGCGLMKGHTSNLDCYIAGVDGNGQVLFTDHATYCDVCVEITSDARNLLKEGKSLAEIRKYVDQVHGEKGPGTETPKPSP